MRPLLPIYRPTRTRGFFLPILVEGGSVLWTRGLSERDLGNELRRCTVQLKKNSAIIINYCEEAYGHPVGEILLIFRAQNDRGNPASFTQPERTSLRVRLTYANFVPTLFFFLFFLDIPRYALSRL